MKGILIIPLLLIANLASASTDTYTVQSAITTAFNPTDGSTYYMGSIYGPNTTTQALNTNVIPLTGVVTGAIVNFKNGGTLGSGEKSIIYLRLASSTDNQLVTSSTNGVSMYAYSNNLNIPVSAGQGYEIKWLAPSWGTNPTSVTVSVTLIIDTDETFLGSSALGTTTLIYASSTPTTYATVGGIGYFLYILACIGTIITMKKFI